MRRLLLSESRILPLFLNRFLLNSPVPLWLHVRKRLWTKVPVHATHGCPSPTTTGSVASFRSIRQHRSRCKYKPAHRVRILCSRLLLQHPLPVFRVTPLVASSPDRKQLLVRNQRCACCVILSSRLIEYLLVAVRLYARSGKKPYFGWLCRFQGKCFIRARAVFHTPRCERANFNFVSVNRTPCVSHLLINSKHKPKLIVVGQFLLVFGTQF